MDFSDILMMVFVVGGVILWIVSLFGVQSAELEEKALNEKMGFHHGNEPQYFFTRMFVQPLFRHDAHFEVDDAQSAQLAVIEHASAGEVEVKLRAGGEVRRVNEGEHRSLYDVGLQAEYTVGLSLSLPYGWSLRGWRTEAERTKRVLPIQELTHTTLHDRTTLKKLCVYKPGCDEPLCAHPVAVLALYCPEVRVAALSAVIQDVSQPYSLLRDLCIKGDRLTLTFIGFFGHHTSESDKEEAIEKQLSQALALQGLLEATSLHIEQRARNLLEVTGPLGREIRSFASKLLLWNASDREDALFSKGVGEASLFDVLVREHNEESSGVLHAGVLYDAALVELLPDPFFEDAPNALLFSIAYQSGSPRARQRLEERLSMEELLTATHLTLDHRVQALERAAGWGELPSLDLLARIKAVERPSFLAVYVRAGSSALWESAQSVAALTRALYGIGEQAHREVFSLLEQSEGHALAIERLDGVYLDLWQVGDALPFPWRVRLLTRQDALAQDVTQWREAVRKVPIAELKAWVRSSESAPEHVLYGLEAMAQHKAHRLDLEHDGALRLDGFEAINALLERESAPLKRVDAMVAHLLLHDEDAFGFFAQEYDDAMQRYVATILQARTRPSAVRALHTLKGAGGLTNNQRARLESAMATLVEQLGAEKGGGLSAIDGATFGDLTVRSEA